jgi:uncharacterized protein
METSSIPSRNRTLHLDIIRGLALFGILLVNMKSFVHPVSLNYVQHPQANLSIDRAVDWLVTFLFNSKFHVIYSVLFGAGFAMMMEKMQQKGQSFAPAFVRRMLALGLLGVLHAHLVWTGDILFTYSIAGLLLVLLFKKTPAHRLRKWAVVHTGVLILVTAAMFGVIEILGRDPKLRDLALTEAFDPELKALAVRSELIQRVGSYADVVRQNAIEWQEKIGESLILSTIILGLFLVGAWFQRSGCLTNPVAHKKFLHRTMIGTLLVGLPLNFYAAQISPYVDLMVLDWRQGSHTLCLLLGGILQGIGYLAALVLFAERSALLRLLAPVGQMSLTNYLAQSIFWTFVCYGYGLGLAESLSSQALQAVLALAFFILQGAASHWWLARFHHGPVEYVWRLLTYLEKPKSGFVRPRVPNPALTPVS